MIIAWLLKEFCCLEMQSMADLFVNEKWVIWDLKCTCINITDSEMEKSVFKNSQRRSFRRSTSSRP